MASACSMSRGSHAMMGRLAATPNRTFTPAFSKRCCTSSIEALAIRSGWTCSNVGDSPRASARKPRMTRPILSPCSRIASTARRAFSSFATFGRTCSARPIMTPSGVELPSQSPSRRHPWWPACRRGRVVRLARVAPRSLRALAPARALSAVCAQRQPAEGEDESSDPSDTENEPPLRAPLAIPLLLSRCHDGDGPLGRVPSMIMDASPAIAVRGEPERFGLLMREAHPRQTVSARVFNHERPDS